MIVEGDHQLRRRETREQWCSDVDDANQRESNLFARRPGCFYARGDCRTKTDELRAQKLHGSEAT